MKIFFLTSDVNLPTFELLKKSFSILITIFFLFANIGLAKSSHICMGSEMMNNFGFSAKHLECDMDTQEHLPNSQNQQKESKDQCCKNQFELIQLETDQTLKISELSAPKIVFVTAFVQAFLLAKELVFFTISTNSIDPPPIQTEDFTVLYQTFLI